MGFSKKKIWVLENLQYGCWKKKWWCWNFKPRLLATKYRLQTTVNYVDFYKFFWGKK